MPTLPARRVPRFTQGLGTGMRLGGSGLQGRDAAVQFCQIIRHRTLKKQVSAQHTSADSEEQKAEGGFDILSDVTHCLSHATG